MINVAVGAGYGKLARCVAVQTKPGVRREIDGFWYRVDGLEFNEQGNHGPCDEAEAEDTNEQVIPVGMGPVFWSLHVTLGPVVLMFVIHSHVLSYILVTILR